jgi:hypothetical protein
MLRRVALVRTDVSEKLSASFIRVTRIGELGTTLAATSNRRTLRRNSRNIPEDTILRSYRREDLKSYKFNRCSQNQATWSVYEHPQSISHIFILILGDEFQCHSSKYISPCDMVSSLRIFKPKTVHWFRIPYLILCSHITKVRVGKERRQVPLNPSA